MTATTKRTDERNPRRHTAAAHARHCASCYRTEEIDTKGRLRPLKLNRDGICRVCLEVEAEAAADDRANAIAATTTDAYSFDRYGIRNWRNAARMLLSHGVSERDAEIVLRSKWTRWAADASNADHGNATAKDLEKFMTTMRGCGFGDIASLRRS